MSNTEKPIRQYCLVLDFDLTMTDFHTNGNINYNMFYWKSKQNLNSIIYLLEKFKNLNYGIYVVTRNIEQNVIKYLKLHGLISIIDRVYGAINENHMNQCTSEWANYKVDYLIEISRLESIPKSNIYFFDDTKINIKVAKSNGFNNSFEIKFSEISPSSTLLVMELNKILGKHFVKI